MRRIALVLLPALVLAGCASPTNAPPGEEREVADATPPGPEEALELLSATSGDALFDRERVGLVGNFSDQNGRGRIEFLQDRGAEAYAFRVDVAQEAMTISLGFAERGTTTNMVFGENTYVGRDEVPDAESALDLTEDLGDSSSDAEGLLGGALDGGAVDSVEATTYKGRPAWRIAAHNDTATMEAVVYVEGRLPAWFRIVEQGADGNSTAEFEVLYGDEVEVPIATEGERTSFTLDRDEHTVVGPDYARVHGNVTENHTEEVKLDEVEMRAVLETPSEEFGEEPERVALASMKLSEGEATVDGHTFRYVDADGDGLVSAGDSYFMESADVNATLAFFDQWADLYEGKPNVPAPGLLAALAVLAAAAVALVRRR